MKFLLSWRCVLIALLGQVCIASLLNAVPFSYMLAYCALLFALYAFNRQSVSTSLWQETVHYGWLMFSFGGLGMLLGHEVDQLLVAQHHIHLHGHESDSELPGLVGALWNFMTLIMLVFCIPACLCLYQAGNKFQVWFVHLFSCACMLSGMYLAMLISPLLLLSPLLSPLLHDVHINHVQFINHQLIIILMSISGAFGFYVCSILMRFLFGDENSLAPADKQKDFHPTGSLNRSSVLGANTNNLSIYD